MPDLSMHANLWIVSELLMMYPSFYLEAVAKRIMREWYE